MTCHAPTNPEAWEVYFTHASGNSQWFCEYVDGRFVRLSQES